MAGSAVLVALFAALALSAAPARALWRQPQPGAVAVQGGERPWKYRQALRNFADVQYTASIVIGGQEISCVLDTGSFEIMVFGKQCTTCGASNAYDFSRSSTYYRGPMTSYHTFGSGDTFSVEATDTMALGGLRAEAQPFWEVLAANMPLLQDGTLNAIVGVGPANTARKQAMEQAERAINQSEVLRMLRLPGGGADNTAWEAGSDALKTSMKPSILENLRVTDFSFCVSRQMGAPGYFVWNDDARFKIPSAFEELAVEADYHWGVTMTDMALSFPASGAAQIIGCGQGCGAVVDSGTSLIAGPPALVEEMDRMVTSFGNDCARMSEMPDLVFHLGGKRFVLPPEAYVGEVVNDVAAQGALSPAGPLCKSLFAPLEQSTQLGPMVILGLPFFRNYYTTFSRSEVGPPYSQRLFIAPASEDCHPHVASSLVGDESRSEGSASHPPNLRDTIQDIFRRPRLRQPLLRVWLSQVRLPRWARQEKRGYIHL